MNDSRTISGLHQSSSQKKITISKMYEGCDKEPNIKYKTKVQLHNMASFHCHSNYKLLKMKPY